MIHEVKLVHNLINELTGRVAMLDHEQKIGFENIQKKLQNNFDKSVTHMHDLTATVLFPPKVPVEGEPNPTPKVIPETSKMSKDLQEELLWDHNMSNLRSQTDEELRAMLEKVIFHNQRLEEEIPTTPEGEARQQKVIDERELKGYKQFIREINYQRKHPLPKRKDVYWQVLMAHILMENLQDSLLADRKEFEAKTQDAEERQMLVTEINEDIEEVKKHIITLLNMVEYLHEE